MLRILCLEFGGLLSGLWGLELVWIKGIRIIMSCGVRGRWSVL